MVKPRTVADLFAVLLFVGGVGWNLFWTPAPNRVVLEVEELSADMLLQVYYQYDRIGLRDYFEFRSGTEFVHRGDGVRRVAFDLPGGRGLRELRIDAGPTGTGFTLRGVEFGYSFAYRTVPLGRIAPGDLAGRLTAGEGVVVAAGAGGPRLRAGPESAAGWFLPVERIEPWSVPPDVLWRLRLQRMAVAAVAAGLIFFAGRWITGGAGVRSLRGDGPPGALRPPEDRVNAELQPGNADQRCPNDGSPGSRSGGAFRLSVGGLFGPCGIRGLPLFALWVAVLGFLVYEPFLLFEKLFLFRDVASDSVDAFWPMFSHLGELWRESGVPFWSFAYGLGAPVFGWVGDPFLFALWALPPDVLPFGLGWIQFLKVLGAGCFFFLWLRTAGLLPTAAAVAATGLAFSAQMMIRGAWFHYATEVFLVAFALWAVESRVSKGRTLPFVCAVALFCVRGPYGLALWSSLFCGYFLLRLWMRREIGFRPVLGMVPFFLLGFGLGAVFLLPNAATIFLSPRVSGPEAQATGLLSRPFFDLNPPQEWLSSLAGLFAPDILGKGNSYSGWRNYLEGPHLYGGLLVVLLVPQAFFGRSRRTRWLLALALCAVGLYLLVPQARFFLNAYAASYYKMSSFWVTVVLAGAAGLALDRILRRGILGGKTLLVTLLAGVAFLLWIRFGGWPGRFVRIAESRLVFQQVLVLLPLYAGALWMIAVPAGSRIGGRSLAPGGTGARLIGRAGLVCLFGLLAWEVVVFGGGVQRDRLALRADTIATGGLYADDAAGAAAMIAAADSGFHRVARESMSVQLNDALLQGYFGLRSYHSFHPGSVLRFLGHHAFDPPYQYRRTGNSYINGLGDRYALETLLSVGYALAPLDPNPPAPGYERWGRAGDVAIWRNRFFVPLGSVYRAVVSEEQMSGVAPEARDLIALTAAIVPGSELRRTGLPVLADEAIRERTEAVSSPEEFFRFYQRDAERLAGNHLRIESFAQDRIRGRIKLKEPGMLFFSIPAEEGWRFRVNGEERKGLLVHYGFQGLPLPAGSHGVEVFYRPPLLNVGMAITLVSLAGVILLGCRVLRKSVVCVR